MKRKYIICILFAVLLLFLAFLSFRKETPSVVTLGSHFQVDNTDSRRTLTNHVDTLAASGLYYASWGLGEISSYENGSEETISLYDAQIYLLLGEYSSKELAAENMQGWLDAAKTNYEVQNEEKIYFCGQDFTKLTYRFPGKDGPYANGISIFGTLDANAVCIELTCRESFADDPETTMDDFLSCCTYHAD